MAKCQTMLHILWKKFLGALADFSPKTGSINEPKKITTQTQKLFLHFQTRCYATVGHKNDIWAQKIVLCHKNYLVR